MAPEYALDGVFSMKSDVFSFVAWRLWNDGKVLDLLDPLIGNSFSATQVMRCINIGLLCVQEKPEDRPIMSSVVIMLGTPLLEPKELGFKAIFSTKHDEALNQNELHTFNNITLTEQTSR
ncbi:Non-specific serine/threonine protein kinase protein [Dioscorea alata]|uniref:Non-specific serine/threonine protein kinase protein n=1 Tax=Dioscorea alata TaxID=55571 RepID=A0ACB7UK83_DIOAL|nr:Non-specific serine/threonine protein kinase protein [Dioscorea alata]